MTLRSNKKNKTGWQNRIVGYSEKPAKDFKFNPLNWRLHSEQQMSAITAVLAEIGWVWIKPGDTVTSIWQESLFPLGLALINKVITDIEQGKIVKVPQDEAVATWEPALDPHRLFRPELVQLSDGKSNVRHRIESHFQETMRLYSID